MRQNCPVCFEYLFDSVRPTAVLPCGHTIHSDCLKEMERNRQLACPICMKSYADLAPVWRRMDEEARPGLLAPNALFPARGASGARSGPRALNPFQRRLGVQSAVWPGPSARRHARAWRSCGAVRARRRAAWPRRQGLDALSPACGS